MLPEILQQLNQPQQGRGVFDALSASPGFGSATMSQGGGTGIGAQHGTASNLSGIGGGGFTGFGPGGAAMPNYASLGQSMGVNPAALGMLGSGIGAALGPVGMGIGALNAVGNVANTASNLHGMSSSMPDFHPSFGQVLGGLMGFNSQLAGTPSHAQAYGASQLFGGTGMPATLGNPNATLTAQLAMGHAINGGMQSGGGAMDIGAPGPDSANNGNNVGGFDNAGMGGLY